MINESGVENNIDYVFMIFYIFLFPGLYINQTKWCNVEWTCWAHHDQNSISEPDNWPLGLYITPQGKLSQISNILH